MSQTQDHIRNTAKQEAVLLLWLLLAGLFLLPVVIYFIGHTMFGEFSGGFMAFYGLLHSELRGGEIAVWFLVLSPYIVWQLLRLTIHAFRAAGSR
jgi:hypothetical protein